MPDSRPTGTTEGSEAASTEAVAPSGQQLLRARIDEFARQENERSAQHRQKRADFALRSERLIVDVPQRYFAMVKDLREAVSRFNTLHDGNVAQGDLYYEESPGVTMGDINADELRVSLWRKFSRFDLTLRLMARAGKPPVPIIEGHGSYGADYPRRVMMRIEGWIEGGKTIYWYNLDFKRTSMDLNEVPERIVMSVLQIDPSILHKPLPKTQDKD